MLSVRWVYTAAGFCYCVFFPKAFSFFAHNLCIVQESVFTIGLPEPQRICSWEAWSVLFLLKSESWFLVLLSCEINREFLVGSLLCGGDTISVIRWAARPHRASVSSALSICLRCSISVSWSNPVPLPVRRPHIWSLPSRLLLPLRVLSQILLRSRVLLSVFVRVVRVREGNWFPPCCFTCNEKIRSLFFPDANLGWNGALWFLTSDQGHCESWAPWFASPWHIWSFRLEF
jgi:hypothetical protein